MAIKCIKFEVFPNDDTLDYKVIIKELFDLSYNLRLLGNKIINMRYIELMRSIQTDAVEFKDFYGKCFRGYLYDKTSLELPQYNTGNLSSFVQYVHGKNCFDNTKILKGEESLTCFKCNMPIFIHGGNYVFYDNGSGKIKCDISLFSRAKQSELGCKRITFMVNKPDDSTKATICKLISKEYKPKEAYLKYNQRKKKWMMHVTYNFMPQVNNFLSDKRILGVDLGVTNVATMNIYDIETEQYDKLSWAEKNVSGAELIRFRQKVYQQRRNMSIASKWSSDSKIGHGYKKRTQAVNKLGDKIDRFKDTYNHKVSRYIVDFAVKYHCGVIQMEDLKGFSDKAQDSLLKNWSYYDLQAKIKYKAEEVGIQVVLVNPKYTSKRCSVCGCIHEDNRDCKNAQSKFKCVRCGNEMNADDNASRNLALPLIDEIIAETAVDI